MKILIIEDDKIIRHALNRVFVSRGHEVFTSSDGKEGVDAWKKEKPDIVLLDIIMPRLSGSQILGMKQDLPKAKIVVMSAYTGDQYSFKSLAKLADMSLTKPFDDIFAVAQQIEELNSGKTRRHPKI